MEDAEEQYGTALRGHLQVIDSLQNMQYARMKTMQEQFQANLKVGQLLQRAAQTTRHSQASLVYACCSHVKRGAGSRC